MRQSILGTTNVVPDITRYYQILPDITRYYQQPFFTQYHTGHVWKCGGRHDQQIEDFSIGIHHEATPSISSVCVSEGDPKGQLEEKNMGRGWAVANSGYHQLKIRVVSNHPSWFWSSVYQPSLKNCWLRWNSLAGLTQRTCEKIDKIDMRTHGMQPWRNHDNFQQGYLQPKVWQPAHLKHRQIVFFSMRLLLEICCFWTMSVVGYQIWLVVWLPFFIFPEILGISSSQLTFILFRGVAQPPTRNLSKGMLISDELSEMI